jgi:hypothetical protein
MPRQRHPAFLRKALLSDKETASTGIKFGIVATLATAGAMTLDRRRSYCAVGALAGWR